MAKFHRLNEHIQAAKLRVIDSQGELLGILTKTEALEKAKELGLDLIEIAPNADPPVAKITDFQKFRYEENKKERASKKGASAGDLKELWLSPRIAEHDLNVRLARTEEFLKGGHKVKLTVKFKGREMAHQELGYKVLQEAINLLGEKAAIEREPKMEGRKLSMIVGKGKGKQNAETKNE
ncbi:translation initiation factor IF-3 [Candidatus Daviesbacteria bacterium RIFCSPHIGHO2_01_FULL_40_24]|nr:MAG: translation initiation factor IF-3 [Candidatus Daviesbacteria bacterium RIFCSPHIGHO2_01_FULL_40_24]OGE28509.1 MAG: translation initiation factor IF-3 [Candidatus Daviesbacteria bacterium RIFCSPHIGHO2_02_FULL_40_16]OGE42377.1 MAG: translation initiation factor IF-3 [Candidatus Daviesbacteria bacterium RIFCSPLOWO2_01_FULL_39_23]OGE66264.1 MAG: translation initiation factor IF-3 [Candidatus Daviesbacteria bacterium RIFCSPLOWO2_02_FULL_39_13]HCE31264.1 translation initiation factor IF-3 [Ca